MATVAARCTEHSGVARICLVVGHKMGALARPRKIDNHAHFRSKFTSFASARERCTISLDVDQPKISMQAKKLML